MINPLRTLTEYFKRGFTDAEHTSRKKRCIMLTRTALPREFPADWFHDGSLTTIAPVRSPAKTAKHD